MEQQQVTLLRKRQSKVYLIVGSAHLGVSCQILKVLQQVKMYFNAEVVHLGRTVTREEKEMHNRRSLRIKTWEKENKEQETQRKEELEKAKGELKDKLSEESFKSRIKNIKARQDADRLSYKRTYQSLADEIDSLEGAQQLRVDFLNKYLGPVTFVTNNELCLAASLKETGIKTIQDSLSLSRHLYCGAVPANGDKVSNSPITRRILRTFKNKGKSWIVPHPIPAISSFPREGLNSSFCYYSTGSLQERENPKTPGELYLSSHSPAAVLILVDSATGEFYAQHLHIDSVWEEISHRNQPIITTDGLVFTTRSVSEVSSANKAMFSTDAHSPHHHLGVLAAIQATNQLHQPETFFDGGDCSDFESVCRHTKSLPGAREGKRLVDDLTVAKKFLDAETDCSSIKRRVLLDSNHASWLDTFVLENPALIGMVDWKTIARQWAPWEVIIREGEDRVVRFFDMVLRHGDMEGSLTRAASLFTKYGCGHWHSLQSIGRCVSIGPACQLGLSYLGTAMTSWTSMFATLTAYKGSAAISPKTVLHDEERRISKFSYRNAIYQVNWE